MFKVVNWKTDFVYKTFKTEHGAKIAAGKLNSKETAPSPNFMAGFKGSRCWEVVKSNC